MSDRNTVNKQHQYSSAAHANQQNYPVFYLYTLLGQNETKRLKKAQTNRLERQVLAEIFDLPASLISSEENHKVEELRLDFHYNNYTFCKENQFSNEKTSTLLALLDSLLDTMLEKQMSI